MYRISKMLYMAEACLLKNRKTTDSGALILVRGIPLLAISQGGSFSMKGSEVEGLVHTYIHRVSE
jgi:hypothetical protein